MGALKFVNLDPMTYQRPRRLRSHELAPQTLCRVARREQGLTQKQLAELAGIPQPYVSKIELGRQDVLREDLEAVAKVLDVSPDELMSEVTE